MVRALLLIPWVVSAVAAAYVWRWILHSDYGLVSGILKSWGVIDRPAGLADSKSYVMPTLIAVNVWKEFRSSWSCSQRAYRPCRRDSCGRPGSTARARGISFGMSLFPT